LYHELENCLVLCYSLLPIATNRNISKLNHENKKVLKQVILFQQLEQARANRSFCANDILELMMSTSNNDNMKVDGDQLSIQDVVDECKTLYQVGFATTSIHLAWIMLLLAKYPKWQ
jgi:cytochrome P450